MDPLITEREWKLRIVRFLSTGVALFGLKLFLNPKSGFQMAKNKKLFEDEKDERVIFTKNMIRWLGLFMLMTGWSTGVFAQLDGVTKDLHPPTLYGVRLLGFLYVLDGLIVKLWGFSRSNIFEYNDSVVPGIVDSVMGMIFLSLK